MEALDPRFYTAKWLDEQILSGGMMFFADGESAVIFKVDVYPTGWRELRWFACTGDVAELTEKFPPVIEGFAKQVGCKSAKIQSREAWCRIMKGQGYELYQTIIEKDL